MVTKFLKPYKKENYCRGYIQGAYDRVNGDSKPDYTEGGDFLQGFIDGHKDDKFCEQTKNINVLITGGISRRRGVGRVRVKIN